MKKLLCASLAIAAANAAVRMVSLLRHPQWSAPVWLPVLIAFVGAFLGSFAVLAAIRLFRTLLKK